MYSETLTPRKSNQSIWAFCMVEEALWIQSASMKPLYLPLMWAPGFTHSPNKMGSVAMVTVMMTSAPVTASCTDEQTRTSPCTVLANFSAFSLVRFHILTWEWVTERHTGVFPHCSCHANPRCSEMVTAVSLKEEHSIKVTALIPTDYLLSRMETASLLKKVGTFQFQSRTQLWLTA